MLSSIQEFNSAIRNHIANPKGSLPYPFDVDTCLQKLYITFALAVSVIFQIYESSILIRWIILS